MMTHDEPADPQPSTAMTAARRRGLPGWLLVLIVAAGACSGAAQRPVRQAPDMTLPSLKGGVYGLRAQVGRVLVLDFMSSWCQTCTEALPGVQRLAKRWQARDVRVWVVSTDEDRADLEAVLKRVPVVLPVLLDAREAWFKHFGLAAVPTAVILGRDGKVAAIVNEPAGEATYEDAIESALKRLDSEPKP